MKKIPVLLPCLIALNGFVFAADMHPVAPAMTRAQIEAGLKSHDRALFIKNSWIRDPYIVLGPDDYYYLTGTTPLPGDPREETDPYNKGLGNSIVGNSVRIGRSKALVEWEDLGEVLTKADSMRKTAVLWAPELIWLGNRWAVVYGPGPKADLALTQGAEIKGPWEHPMGPQQLGQKHDQSMFKDGETWWLLWDHGDLAPFKKDFSGFAAAPSRIDPSGSRPGPKGENQPINRIGHEGTCMLKVGAKYVFIGTAWSTDIARKGSYNLYYCTADKITGPYGPRRFLGRFLGHGTPFQTRDGSWWCTAFYNANVPPLPREGIERRDLGGNAQTINQRGVTIVPLEVKTLPDGDASIRAMDPVYAAPGPDENQKF